MFSFGGNHDSPSRSPSVQSANWTSGASSPSRDSNWNSTNGSPTSSVASFRTNSSVASNGVKTRQIRDLKLENELKDARITELEQAYESLERKSAYAQGETQNKLETCETEMAAMSAEQDNLRGTIAEQQVKLEEVNKTLTDFQSMHDSFKAMLQRCAELEEFQRKKQAEEEEAKKKAEEEAAAKKAEEEAAAKKAAEEEAAKQAAEEEERRFREAEAAAKQEAVRREEEARIAAQQQYRGNARRSANFGRANNNVNRRGGDGCSIM